MKILFVTSRLLYPVNRGDKVRPFNFARSLSQKHNLSLLSFIQSKDEIQHIEVLKKWFDSVDTICLPPWKSYLNMALNILSGKPLQVSYFKSSQFKKKIDQILGKNDFDMVYIFHLRMVQYFLKKNDIYRVLDLCDSVSFFMQRLIKHAKWYMKPIYAYEISRVKSYEQDLMKYFEEYWIISEEDRAQLEADSHFEKLYIVKNGIDTDYFSRNQWRGENGEQNTIIFVGYMGVESVDAIYYFYNQILPLIKKEIPDFRWYIVGANPPDKVKSLANDKNIIVTGYVEDLRDWYEKASVAIAPMRFVAGMQNKILEAMSMSLPVVTTSYGNEGINAKEGETIFVEDEPKDFAWRIVQLLRDDNLREEMGNKARRFVEEKYSWNVVLDRVEEIEKQILGKRNVY